ncbi:MAG: LacI family DNA-binding transcriptional regulator [Bacillota bacterium]
MANIKDVAEKAGVSTATVSHVINETRYVSEETKNKVLKSMDELNYEPNNIARSLRSKETKTIGFIVPDISNFFFTEMAHYIEQELKEKGYSLILNNSNEDIENEKKQLKTLYSQMIDGLIIAPTRGDQSYLDKIRQRNKTPIVFIDRKPENINGIFILVDNYQGAYDAIELLIKKGYQKISIITGLSGLTTTKERLDGYKAALEENNIEVDDSLIKIGDSKYESGYKLTAELVENTDTDAIFVANNLMAIGSMFYLKKQKINIPSDIALIGFDNYKWAEITAPPLTSVRQPVDEMGIKSVEVLLKKIKENHLQQDFSKEVRLKTEIIERESC